MARRRGSSTGHYAAGCVTVTLLVALSLLLRRAPAPEKEKRCDLSSYDPASTEEIDLKRCNLVTLPAAIAEFRWLKKLDLGFNALQALPALPPSLEVLFLLANSFEEVPLAISPLPRLRMLSFKSCALRAVGVPLPASLQWLILTDNRLEELPHQIGELVLMRKLMLSNNRALSIRSARALHVPCVRPACALRAPCAYKRVLSSNRTRALRAPHAHRTRTRTACAPHAHRTRTARAPHAHRTRTARALCTQG